MAAPRKIDPAALRRMWADPFVTQEALALHFGCTRQTVFRAAKRLGLPPRLDEPRKIDPAALRRMWSDPSVTQVAMADHFGCAASAITRAARRLDLPPRPKRPAGSGRQPEPPRPAAPVPVRAAPVTPPEPERDAALTGRLVASKGRYAALAEIAGDQGWTMREAQRQWHLARCGT